MQGSDGVQLTTLKIIPNGEAIRLEKVRVVGWKSGGKVSPPLRPETRWWF